MKCNSSEIRKLHISVLLLTIKLTWWTRSLSEVQCPPVTPDSRVQVCRALPGLGRNYNFIIGTSLVVVVVVVHYCPAMPGYSVTAQQWRRHHTRCLSQSHHRHTGLSSLTYASLLSQLLLCSAGLYKGFAYFSFRANFKEWYAVTDVRCSVSHDLSGSRLWIANWQLKWKRGRRLVLLFAGHWSNMSSWGTELWDR